MVLLYRQNKSNHFTLIDEFNDQDEVVSFLRSVYPKSLVTTFEENGQQGYLCDGIIFITEQFKPNWKN